jgi:hypothetical protein
MVLVNYKEAVLCCMGNVYCVWLLLSTLSPKWIYLEIYETFFIFLYERIFIDETRDSWRC